MRGRHRLAETLRGSGREAPSTRPAGASPSRFRHVVPLWYTDALSVGRFGIDLSRAQSREVVRQDMADTTTVRKKATDRVTQPGPSDGDMPKPTKSKSATWLTPEEKFAYQDTVEEARRRNRPSNIPVFSEDGATTTPHTPGKLIFEPEFVRSKKRIYTPRVSKARDAIETLAGILGDGVRSVILDYATSKAMAARLDPAEQRAFLIMKKEHDFGRTSKKETAKGVEARPRVAVDKAEIEAEVDPVKLVFGDIPDDFRTRPYTKNPHPELIRHPAVLTKAKEIVSANSRTKIADLSPPKREQLRQARRIVRANERQPAP